MGVRLGGWGWVRLTTWATEITFDGEVTFDGGSSKKLKTYSGSVQTVVNKGFDHFNALQTTAKVLK